MPRKEVHTVVGRTNRCEKGPRLEAQILHSHSRIIKSSSCLTYVIVHHNGRQCFSIFLVQIRKPYIFCLRALSKIAVTMSGRGLRGRLALITGATGGIGSATARARRYNHLIMPRAVSKYHAELYKDVLKREVEVLELERQHSSSLKR